MVPKIEDIIPICGELHKEPVTTDIARRYGLGEDGLSVREQIREQMIARFMRAIRAHRRRLSAARSMKDPELRKLAERCALSDADLKVRRGALLLVQPFKIGRRRRRTRHVGNGEVGHRVLGAAFESQ